MASSVLQHNQRILQDLKAGDLVEFTGIIYSHWAVYIGNDEIVHLTGTNESKIDKGHVVRDTLLRAAGNCKVRKNNDKDRKYTPLPGWQIVQRAKEWIGRRGYNVAKWNCEHFVNFIRYGVRKSGQVDRALVYVLCTAAGVVIGGLATDYLANSGGVVGAVAGFCIGFFANRYKSRNTIRMR